MQYSLKCCLLPFHCNSLKFVGSLSLFFFNGSFCVCFSLNAHRFLEKTNKQKQQRISLHQRWGRDGQKQQHWCVGEWCGKLLSQQPRWERKSLHGEKRWKSEWKLSRLLLWPAPLRTQRLHHKQLVGGEMWSASACGQIVSFSFFSLYLFLLKEMRGSIDWEDRRPLCGRKCVSAARKYLEITKSRLYFLSSLNETLGCHSYER